MSVGEDVGRAGRPGVSRRAFVAGGAAAGVGALVRSAPDAEAAAARPVAGRGADPARPPGDLLLANGRIHTMDPSDRVVSSVLMSGGRFTAVGNKPAAPRGVAKIDLQGRTVVPGLVDLHNHVCLVGNRPGYHQPLDHLWSITAILEQLKVRRRDVPEGQFITCIGTFSPDHVIPEHRPPTRAELDSAVADRPVYIQTGPFGPSTTNGMGRAWLRARGVTVAENGSIDTAGSHLALAALRRAFLDPAARKRGAADALKHWLSHGVTTVVDAGALPTTGVGDSDATVSGDMNYGGGESSIYTPFLSLHAEGRLPARMWLNFVHFDTVSQEARMQMAFPFYGDEWMKTGGIGEFGSQDPVGIRSIAKHGWRFEQHVLADLDPWLARFEAVNAEISIKDLRWVLSHVLPSASAGQCARAKAMGVGFLIFGSFLGGPLVALPQVPGIPVDLTKAASLRALATSWRTIVNSGMQVGFHSDSGDLPHTDPWAHLYHFVTGRDSRGVLINNGQQLTRQQALELATSRARWFMNDEPLGSIQVGNYADLAVLTDDYFRIPADQIKHLRSDLTIVNGVVAHNTGVLGRRDRSVSVKSLTAKVLRRKGKRTLQLRISAGERVRVRIKLTRNGKTLAGKTVRALAAGTHTVLLAIDSDVAAGRARLTVTFTDAVANTKTYNRSIAIPRR